jgi:DNA-binding Lrp family transcriptional regulator
MVQSEGAFEADELDLLLLEAVVQHPEVSYKDLAELVHVDQRTAAKRIRNLVREGVLKQAVEIDWSKLGLQVQAFVGSTTARGLRYAVKFDELIRTDPRIVEAYETVGSNQYSLKVIDTDVLKLRDSVLRDLDPLAAELTTSLVAKKIKQDYQSLLRYHRVSRFPRSRALSHAPPQGSTSAAV